MRNEKGIEFINNVHLKDGYRDSTVSFLLINNFVKIEKINIIFILSYFLITCLSFNPRAATLIGRK